MTNKWLASIQSIEEARLLLSVLPNILDLKNPSQGALGALPVSVVADIVNLVDGQCRTSATIGDLTMNADLIAQAIIEMAASGVDYVKIGLFPDPNLAECLQQLSGVLLTVDTPVIAVVFADKPLNIDIHHLVAQAGFKGIMIDTAIKNGQHLLDHMNSIEIKHFVTMAKNHNLLCGLAGALRYDDIAKLATYDADYLGFRSALCQQRQRTSQLDLEAVNTIKQAISAL